jgi:hypothetical protein
MPCYWNVQLDLGLACTQHKPSCHGTTLHGLGLSKLIAYGLHDDTILLFQDISRLDSIIETLRVTVPPRPHPVAVLDARNCLQWRLLALPPGEDLVRLPGLDALGTYEVCRLCALLYSNHVLFPIPPTTGWLDKLLSDLDKALVRHEASAYRMSNDLLLWVTAVATIASVGTRWQSKFSQRLGVSLRVTGLHYQEDIGQVLKQFIWAHSAGSEGLTAVLTDMH